MADLDVQPKKKSSILPWVLLGLGLLVLLLFLGRGCSDNDSDDAAATTTDSATSSLSNTASNTAQSVRNWWDDVDFNAPAATYDEITNKDVDVRGNDNYAVYGINETVLFDEGKSTIRPGAEATLKQVAASINKRYNDGNVRVYGYTDAVGSAGANKELAEQRAQAVQAWLAKNSDISESNISVHPVGESQPVASNATASGRQQNRRVEIVAGHEGGGGVKNGATAGDSAGTR
jgi:outer membrane protein OmpA-like peptidoglycan-associated protein